MENYKYLDNKTYKELKKEYDYLSSNYEAIRGDCVKEGLSFGEFSERAKDVKEKMYFIDKYIRIKESPTVEYGKEWNGDIFTFEEFKKQSEHYLLIDADGIGYYATENAKSNIEIEPSDILEGIYRKDFTHIIWFSK